MKYEKAIALIKDYEKCRLKAYKCPAGVWTIGWGNTNYGHGIPVKDGDKISQPQADELFENHFGAMENQVRALLKFPNLLSENQMGAVLSLVYNIGIGNFEKSTLRKKLNELSPPTGFTHELYIAHEFQKWNKVKGKESKGLTRRRAEERALFLESNV